jgi:hypothetical protein
MAARYLPSRGDRVEQTRIGVRRTGTVWYADQLQVLVKWDDGGSSSLPLRAADLRLVAAEPSTGAAEGMAALPAPPYPRT